MATVRIYKVAELLGLSSQDAMALLKQETGIDVKSASSSIEEIVARQFVERQARKRQIALPPGTLFAETPVAEGPRQARRKAPEPPKPRPPCCVRVWSRRSSRCRPATPSPQGLTTSSSRPTKSRTWTPCLWRTSRPNPRCTSRPPRRWPKPRCAR